MLQRNQNIYDTSLLYFSWYFNLQNRTHDHPKCQPKEKQVTKRKKERENHVAIIVVHKKAIHFIKYDLREKHLIYQDH